MASLGLKMKLLLSNITFKPLYYVTLKYSSNHATSSLKFSLLYGTFIYNIITPTSNVIILHSVAFWCYSIQISTFLQKILIKSIRNKQFAILILKLKVIFRNMVSA